MHHKNAKHILIIFQGQLLLVYSKNIGILKIERNFQGNISNKVNYGSSRGFLFTILQSSHRNPTNGRSSICKNLTVFVEISIFYEVSGFVLACRDWQSPKLDNLKEIKLFYLRESLWV